MAYAKSDMILADPNIKPAGGPTLKKKTDRVIGTRFYLPSDTDHYCTFFVNTVPYLPHISALTNSTRPM
eukprot:384919-Ditylum_brightwellii.AAC.1